MNTDSARNRFPLKIGHWEQFVFMNCKPEFEGLELVLIFRFMRKTIFLCHNTCRHLWVNKYSELSIYKQVLQFQEVLQLCSDITQLSLLLLILYTAAHCQGHLLLQLYSGMISLYLTTTRTVRERRRRTRHHRVYSPDYQHLQQLQIDHLM